MRRLRQAYVQHARREGGVLVGVGARMARARRAVAESGESGLGGGISAGCQPPDRDRVQRQRLTVVVLTRDCAPAVLAHRSETRLIGRRDAVAAHLVIAGPVKVEGPLTVEVAPARGAVALARRPHETHLGRDDDLTEIGNVVNPTRSRSAQRSVVSVVRGVVWHVAMDNGTDYCYCSRMARERRWRVTQAVNFKQTGEHDAAGRKLHDAAPRISVRFEIEDAAWRAIYSIGADGGRVAISEIRIEPVDPSSSPLPPLPAQLARDLLRPGQALEEAQGALAVMVRPDVLADWHGIDAAALGIERRGKRRPDYFYTAIASHYIDARESNPASPVAHAASRLPAGYGPPFVRDALHEARQRELLERPGQGRAGGQLTAHGLAVLKAGPPENYEGPAPAVSGVRQT